MIRKKRKDASIGQRARLGREKLGLSLEDVSHETGYPLDVIIQVEEDKIVPPVSLLIQLSRVLKLNMEEAEEEEAKATKIRKKSHRKRVDSYAYVPLTKPGDDKHLRAYLVTIDPKTEHRGVEYHHEGEEFIHVLKGGLIIKVGDNIRELARGESIHFNSALHHKLSNPKGESAKLLVVIYVP
jgi:mannose-6-phosphate isomerase-like protein (cupin superfamily)